MKLKLLAYIIFITSIIACIAIIFWKQEYRYMTPTPRPDNLKEVSRGDQVNLPFSGDKKNTFIHFYNFHCPCSRFNIKEFQSMVRRYSGKVNFIAVLQTEGQDADEVQRFRRKYDMGIEVISDSKGEIAKALGVYSTPQAVILKNDTIFYKGNYNRARFCLSRNTRFAELALEALINNESAPVFPPVAEIAYGCELPSNSTKKTDFLNFF